MAGRPLESACFSPQPGRRPASRRNYPVIASNRFRAIHRFDSPNSVTNCAVFFAKPLKRTFAIFLTLVALNMLRKALF